MTPNPDTAVREFDHRENGGIAVRLLWNSHTNCVSVAVEDKRAGESFQLTMTAPTRWTHSNTRTHTPTTHNSTVSADAHTNLSGEPNEPHLISTSAGAQR
jgi:hypothetical protein